MHCTADTETGDYIEDPTQAQLENLITGLGARSGSFITIGPADDSQDWYASVSLLPDGTTEIEHGDPARSEHYRAAVTTSPAGIARDLSAWLSTRS
jgi:hypothetical protein